MKKYILLSVMLLTGGMNLICMEQKHQEDTLSMAHKQTRECLICLDNKETDQFTPLSCCAYDASCADCLLEMITTSLQEKTIARINCPNRNCAKSIVEQDIRAITNTNPETYKLFSEIATNEYLIMHEKQIKHCPTPDCSYSFINDHDLKQVFNCPQCKHLYCSSCLVRHAQEMTCEQAKRERELAENADLANQATQKWIADNTKECPACHKSIQKNGGCNHMTCKQCLHEFCWTCGATFRTTRCNTNYCATTNQVPINENPNMIDDDEDLYGPLNIVNFLLNATANVNQTNNHRMTPLMLAAQNGHHDIVNLLLAHPDIQVNQGQGRGPVPDDAHLV